MPGEKSGYTPELNIEQTHLLIRQYLSDHADLSIREQEFLLQYYKSLKTEMTQRSAKIFRKEAVRVKGQTDSSEEFKSRWGTKFQEPESGANATKLFMDEVGDIQETAARQALVFFEMRRIAEIDHLTNLYRGPAFEKYAEETLRINQESARQLNKGKRKEERLVSAYVALDIDNFKMINDSIGHDRADKEILVEVGRVIKETVRSTDLASRRSGDEFLILFGRIRFDSIKLTIERLLKALQTISYEKDGKRYPITASAGVKIIETDEQITLKEASQLADETANLAKIEKNTHLIYAPDLPERIEQMILEDAEKPDEQNRGLQFYIRQQHQLNKRALEDISTHNLEAMPGYLESLREQARINLKTRLKKLQKTK